MKIITNYGQFLNENIESPKELLNILDILKNTPTKDILMFRDSLKQLASTSESLNENIISNFIDKIKLKFRNIIDDRIWKYLINRKKDFYVNLIDKLDIFDIYSISDIKRNYTGFKLEALYLAGGMDKAKDVGAGWRLVVENEFEKYPGKKSNLPEINLGEFGKVHPRRVVDGIYLDQFIENPSATKKLYDKPLILNPVRKEVDRTKDVEFSVAANKYKKFTQSTKPEEYEPTMTNIRKTLSSSIEPGDEHLVRLADAVFLGLNQSAAAGTYGELQTQSFMNKPIFVWMTSPEWKLGTTTDDPYGGFSMWTFPHISKLARNKEEMEILVNTILSNMNNI
jgi:hypothetical protein